MSWTRRWPQREGMTLEALSSRVDQSGGMVGPSMPRRVTGELPRAKDGLGVAPQAERSAPIASHFSASQVLNIRLHQNAMPREGVQQFLRSFRMALGSSIDAIGMGALAKSKSAEKSGSQWQIAIEAPPSLAREICQQPRDGDTFATSAMISHARGKEVVYGCRKPDGACSKCIYNGCQNGCQRWYTLRRGRALDEQQQQSEEEQRRREAAEERAGASQPLTLHQYLETCHSLSLTFEVVTDRSLATQGDTTNPTGRIYPRRIIPWTTFAREQEQVWNQLSFSPPFSSQATFPSRHQLDYVRSLLRPVSSEIGLRNGDRDVVENAVQKLTDATHTDSLLRSHLGLNGTVTFESHTNLGISDDSLSESMEQVSIGSRPPDRTTRRRKARGKGNRADQFCIYRTSDEQNIPTVAIEDKAPHKLRRGDIVTGLVSEIQPDRDVINQEGEGYAFAARRLTTAVVTQLFSYMIGKGIQYGYVCTGEAYVFLHIPDDPSCVYYSVCVPSLDVQDDDETRIHRTAVAQALAFVLQAIRSPPPRQAWHDATEHLDTWSVEYEDVLRSIPATDRKLRRETPYKAQR
ncbi:hypothetical protein B0J13DRAFT_533387 [Dactylonectria estremocensis]|uniref:Uncharacterized protein n=1 Tax=Dactylonectria estremocensis TaxID=1079267 RepID=A0A9P9DAQ0_9HYPO|nr:hypothetical protein B0J13DRAFT_533387 [Dactylonectria estremocensis]